MNCNPHISRCTAFRAAFVITLTLLCSLYAEANMAIKTLTLQGKEFNYITSTGKESLYAISKKAGIDIDTLQNWNKGISGESHKGTKIFWPADSKEIISTSATLSPAQEITYNVKWGDTFHAIAERFNTTVEDIFLSNSTLTPTTLRQGELIKLHENSANEMAEMKSVTIPTIVAFNTYTVKKDESWEGIARTNGLTAELLREANPEITELKKNVILAIPVTGEATIIEYNITRDPRELTDMGVNEIYASTVKIQIPEQKSIAVVLSNPASNKDIDFSRGFLLALSKAKDLEKKVDVTFVNGNANPVDDNAVINADIIVTTYEKDLPKALSELAGEKIIINVFDLKDDTYLSRENIYNMLQSPEIFNNDAKSLIMQRFGDAQFVFLGDPLKAGDALASDLMSTLPMDHFEVTENLDETIAPYSGDFVIYVLGSKKEEIQLALKQIEKFRSENADHDNIIVLGRPTWIMYESAFGEQMHAANTYFPSRFYLNVESEAGKAFTSDYTSMWVKQPVKSYPQFAAMGYDTATWLLSIKDPIQIQRNFKQYTPAGGFINHTCMLVHLAPEAVTEIIEAQ